MNLQPRLTGALSRTAIAELIAGDPPLLEEYHDIDAQLQPNGFDVSVRAVSAYDADSGSGSIGVSDGDRALRRCPGTRSCPSIQTVGYISNPAPT